MIRAATTVQDGHSIKEQAVYNYLWMIGEAESQQTRTIKVGAAMICRRAAMSKVSARRALRALVRKHAIEILEPCDPYTMGATTWRIYGYELLLQLRSQAGLKWADSGPGGQRELLTDEEAKKIPQERWTPAAWSAAHRNGNGHVKSTPPAPPAPAANRDRARSSAPIRDHDQVLEAIAIALDRANLAADTAAPRQILTACQAIDQAQARAFDGGRLMHALGKTIAISRDPKIQTPIAFVISMTPKNYGGKGYEQERTIEKRRAADEAAEAARQVEQREAQRIEDGLLALRDELTAAEVSRRWPDPAALHLAADDAMSARCADDKHFAAQMKRLSKTARADVARQLLARQVRETIQLPSAEEWAAAHPKETR